MAREALVVDSRAEVVSMMTAALRGAGYSAAGATSFEEARDALDSTRPLLLVTSSRLGAFNGLHLVIRARHDHPRTTAVVISEGVDPFVRSEAETYGAKCLAGPVSTDELVSFLDRIPRPMADVTPIRPGLRIRCRTTCSNAVKRPRRKAS